MTERRLVWGECSCNACWLEHFFKKNLWQVTALSLSISSLVFSPDQKKGKED
jgi:hypothetical protein